MTTQPTERPEPPYWHEDYRLVTEDEKKRPLPSDALVWMPEKGHWAYSPNAGRITPNPDFIYATRTPIPEQGTAGQFQKGGDEPCASSVQSRTTPASRAEETSIIARASNAPAAVQSGSQGQPPTLAPDEKDQEIARLRASMETYQETEKASYQSLCNLPLYAADDSKFTLPMSGPAITARDCIRTLRARNAALESRLESSHRAENSLSAECDDINAQLSTAREVIAECKGAIQFYADIANFHVTVWEDDTKDGKCWLEPAKDHSLQEEKNGSSDFGLRALDALARIESLEGGPK